MKRLRVVFPTILSLMLVTLFLPTLAQAQGNSPNLSITTTYPSQVAQLGASVSISLSVKTTDVPQTAEMSMGQLPDGWTATFLGGGRVIQSVYVDANSSGTVDVRLDPPKDEKSGTYNFVVLAQSSTGKAELPITLTVQEQVPASLSFTTDLPTIKGSRTIQ